MKAEDFEGCVAKYMKKRHITTKEQLRAHTTVGSSTTFRKYFKEPDLIPIGVFNQIMTALKVPSEERYELLK